jgi:predicted TPR repeat methyltransferase
MKHVPGANKVCGRRPERDGYMPHDDRNATAAKLQEAELTGFITARPAAYDLIVSADTLFSFGDLREVMAAAVRGLRPGGHLIFNVEHGREESGAPAAGYRLHPNGRYCHGEAYVRRVLAAAGMEMGAPVAGLVVTAAAVAPAG